MKTKLLIATIFALIATASVNAQWFEQTSATASNLYSIHCVNDTTCYSVGYLTAIRKTVDGGATFWTTGYQAGGSAITDKYFVKMYNKDIILLGQANGTFARTTNGSTTFPA